MDLGEGVLVEARHQRRIRDGLQMNPRVAAAFEFDDYELPPRAVEPEDVEALFGRVPEL